MTRTRQLLIIVTVLTNLMPLSALAVSADDMQSANDNTVFYDPDYTAPCGTTGTGAITLTGKDALEQAYTALASNLSLNAVQAAGIMGNLMWESGGGVTIRPNADENDGTATYPTANDGFGIAQWTPAAGQQPLVALAQKEDVLPNTLAVQVQYLIDELKNNQEVPNIPDESSALSAIKTTNSVDAATTSFMNNFEHPGVPDLAQRESGANAVYAAYGSEIKGGSTGGTTPTTGTGCTAGGPNTGIVGTALNFAWPKPDCQQTYKDSAGNTETRNTCFDATLAYQKGWDGAGGDPPMTDCGAYVASVIIDSKADPNYPAAGTIAQYQYVKTHPSLFQIINTKSTSGLQPGDIMVASNEADGTGHTALYVGTNPGEDGFVAAASWGGNTPQMEGDGSAGEVEFILAEGAPYGAAAARYIGSTAKAVGQ